MEVLTKAQLLSLSELRIRPLSLEVYPSGAELEIDLHTPPINHVIRHVQLLALPSKTVNAFPPREVVSG